MASLMQDSIAGYAIRFLSKGHIFKYAEERDPSLWKQYTNKEKSSRMAYHGRMDSIGDADGIADGVTRSSSRSSRIESMGRIPSSGWSDSGNRFQGLTGMRIDPEKGKDIYLIEWWDEKDQEVRSRLCCIHNEANALKNPQNWPIWKKLFVTFEICLLTFSVYIGSAIFTPGIPTVMQDFGVSQVAATLGLTLFVGGYGLGPLLWSPMSEIPQIGRNPVYIATLIVFVALQVPTALAGNFGTLLAFRFLTGLFGSPALATVWAL